MLFLLRYIHRPILVHQVHEAACIIADTLRNTLPKTDRHCAKRFESFMIHCGGNSFGSFGSLLLLFHPIYGSNGFRLVNCETHRTQMPLQNSTTQKLMKISYSFDIQTRGMTAWHAPLPLKMHNWMNKYINILSHHPSEAQRLYYGLCIS